MFLAAVLTAGELMALRLSNLISCPESVTGHAQNDRSGRCCWCKARVDPPVPRPVHGWGRSALADAYDRAWNPDWGSGRYDQDP